MKNEMEKIKPEIVKLLKKHKVVRAGIFGSYARGDQKKNSDIDILIEFDGSLLDLVKLEREIARKMKKKIDLLTYESISPYLKSKIMKEQIKVI